MDESMLTGESVPVMKVCCYVAAECNIILFCLAFGCLSSV